MFAMYYSLSMFPVVEDVLIVFIQFLSRNFKSPSSVKNYILGLQTFSNIHGFPFPDIKLPHFKFQFKGIARQMLHTPSRACPITPTILEKILDTLNLSDPFQASCWAVMVSGFLLFARIGNLLPKSHSYDRSKQLSRSDVYVARDCLVFSLKWTKTIQFAQRVLQVPLYANPHSRLCPKKALLNMVKVSPNSPRDHLFSYSTSFGSAIITQYQFVDFLRQKLNQCGYSDSQFSGHSFRRGGASCAFSKGVPSELIKSHDDWRSDAYRIYLEFSMSDRLVTTRQMLN